MVISLKFISSCPTLVCMSLENGQFLFSMISSQKSGRKVGKLSLENCCQKFGENWKNSEVKFIVIVKRQWTVVESNIHKSILLKHNFSL